MKMEGTVEMKMVIKMGMKDEDEDRDGYHGRRR